MKNNLRISLALITVGIILSVEVTAQKFIHPGILHNSTELEFVKSKVEALEEPWKSAWDQLYAHQLAQLTWVPNPISNVLRGTGGRFRCIYERIYHHYHDRMGLEMTFTKQVIDKIRPESWHIQHAAWGTLMYANLPE